MSLVEKKKKKYDSAKPNKTQKEWKSGRSILILISFFFFFWQRTISINAAKRAELQSSDPFKKHFLTREKKLKQKLWGVTSARISQEEWVTILTINISPRLPLSLSIVFFVSFSLVDRWARLRSDENSSIVTRISKCLCIFCILKREWETSLDIYECRTSIYGIGVLLMKCL
jgi:hypothetical protein